MRKLLSAGFVRLRKDKVFWIGIAAVMVIGAFVVVQNYREFSANGYVLPPLDNYFFGFALMIGLVSAAFCSLFLGTEYSDGTIRNKIAVGHSRSAIYLSNLIVCATAALLTNLAYIAAVSAVGIPLFGFLTMGARAAVTMLWASFFTTLAFTALFTLLSMLIQNKAIVAVVSIIGVVGMLVATITIENRLRAPEFYDGIVISEEVQITDPNNPQLQSVPNPNYLQPKERAAYQFLHDLMPTGQAMQISNQSAPHPWLMQLYALLIVLAATGGGIFFFRKKDLK